MNHEEQPLATGVAELDVDSRHHKTLVLQCYSVTTVEELTPISLSPTSHSSETKTALEC